MENKEIPLNVILKLAKDEYINKINEVTEKFGLPICLLEMILDSIVNEVKTIAEQELKVNLQNMKQEEVPTKESDINGIN